MPSGSHSDLTREQLVALVEELERQQADTIVPEATLLRLRDGDVLALVYPGPISREAAEQLKQSWNERLGPVLQKRGVQVVVVVLANGVELKVIRPGED